MHFMCMCVFSFQPLATHQCSVHVQELCDHVNMQLYNLFSTSMNFTDTQRINLNTSAGLHRSEWKSAEVRWERPN